mmetsp:Transcript_147792/g.474419  ORF Transcript_147792/g.474419 Transcript_147792/m.474419 type:complete len:136 (+) Transcript_147792:1551-1958(+)
MMLLDNVARTAQMKSKATTSLRTLGGGARGRQCKQMRVMRVALVVQCEVVVENVILLRWSSLRAAWRSYVRSKSQSSARQPPTFRVNWRASSSAGPTAQLIIVCLYPTRCAVQCPQFVKCTASVIWHMPIGGNSL